MTQHASLGDDIRTRRRSLRLTQQQAADLAGVSTGFIHAVEHGKASVQLDSLLALLEALGLELRTHLRGSSPTRHDDRPNP